MANLILTTTIKEEFIDRAKAAIFSVYGGPKDGKTDKQRAKEIIDNFLKQTVVDYEGREADIAQQDETRIKANEDIT